MQTAKNHAQHGLSGFELSKKVLNNLSQYNLKPTAKLVLLYLCDCYNPKHGQMFPKQKTIALKLGVSEVSVIRAIQELHREGLIISERKYINCYRFTSKIVCEGSEIEHKEMIVKTYQKDNEPIKKIVPHDIEQIKRTNNTTESVEDFKILKDYAEKMKAGKVTNYIASLKRSGAAEKIIKDAKEKLQAEKNAKIRIEETSKYCQEVSQWVGVSPKEHKGMQEVLAKIRQK